MACNEPIICENCEKEFFTNVPEILENGAVNAADEAKTVILTCPHCEYGNKVKAPKDLEPEVSAAAK